MGESARQPGCPEVASTPLELITPRPGEGFSDIEKYVWPTCGTIAGISLVSFMNILLRRPKWASLPIHGLGAGAGYFTSIWVRDKRFAAKAEEDAILKHYISLHPEDFPPFERKRFRDVYERFQPIR